MEKRSIPEISIAELTDEERSDVERLDAITDELYTLRNQLALFTKR